MGSRYRKPWFELEASWRMGTLHGAKGQVEHGEWGAPRSNSKTGLYSAHRHIPPWLSTSSPHFSPSLSQYLWLLVVLHGHGDHVEADHTGDEQIQVVAGAHLVDQEAEAGVIRIVGLTLCFCSGEEESGEARQVISLRLSEVNAPSLSNSKDDKF